jgi:hypothetical protein
MAARVWKNPGGVLWPKAIGFAGSAVSEGIHSAVVNRMQAADYRKPGGQC